MDTELLPPEEEQKQSEVDPQELQRQFDMPSPQRNAGQDAPSRTKQAAGFLKKNKKWFIGGGAGLGLLVPIFMFFFWLMLFKNVHIKNLYVTYRWAQFNRGINKALKGQLEEMRANPDMEAKGGATDTVSQTDPIEDLSSKTAKEFNPSDIDPENVSELESEGKKISGADQSIDGASEKAFKDSGASRNVSPAEGTGDTPEEISRSAEDKAKSNLEDELSKNKTLEQDPPETLKDGVDEAKRLEKDGVSPKDAAVKGAEKAMSGGGKLSQAVQKATGPFIVATFYCIFRDIYVGAKKQINQIVIGGAIGVAQETNKIADCQKLGKCDANQVGAVAEKYDNAEQSFTESCGYTRATQSSNPACKEIDPQFVVNGFANAAGGAVGTAIKGFDSVFDPPQISVLGIKYDAAGAGCKLVMNPVVQGVVAVVNIGGIVASGGSWGAAATAVGEGAAVFAGTAGGKALIASAILKYSGGLYKDLRPWDMGNLKDMGDTVTASATCAASSCPQVSDATVAKLDSQYRTERIAANSKRSIVKKLFDPNSSDSVLSRAILNTPTTPVAIVGRLKTVFASLSNPLQLSHSLGGNVVALSSHDTAFAASDASVYGLSDKVRVPPNLLDGASSYHDVITWGRGRDMSELDAKYKKCSEETYAESVGSDDNTCQWESMSANGRLYIQYKYLQHVAYMNAKARNNQSESASVTNPGGGSNTAGPVFMLGDSITEGLDIVGIAKTFENKGYSPVNIDASRSRGFTVKGVDNARTSAFEALDDPSNISNIKKASYVFVGLGTNPLGNINTSTYGDQIGQTIDKIRSINSSASIYWLNVISPAISQAAARNNTLNQQAAAKNFTVIDATSLKLNFADKVHPDVPSYNTLASFIVSKMTAGSASSGDAKALAQQLLDSPQVSFTTTQAEDALKAIASGGKARVPCLRNDGGGTYISSSLLNALVKVTGKYSIGIGFLTNGCHSDNSAHYSGRAVDINQVNGQRVTGGEKISWDFLTELSNFLPDGSGYGQAGCGVSDTTVRLAHKINIFDDTCNHIHVQVPK